MRLRKRWALTTSLAAVVLLLVMFSAQTVLGERDQYLMTKGLSHYTMGLIHEMNGLTERAIVEYELALEYEPDNAVIHFRIGSNYARLGLMDEAVGELKLATSLSPDDLQSHYLLALIHSSQKEFNKAAEEYEIILQYFSKESPDNIEIYGYLGQLYYSQGQYEKAITQFDKILKIEPLNANVMYLLGSLFLEIKDSPKAIDLFTKSIEIDPGHDGSLNSLGYIYAEEGIKLDEALKLVNKALEIDPENGAYFDSLGWIHFKQGKYIEAIEYLKKADSYLEDPVIYEHIGDAYRKLDQFDKAREYWENSLEILPKQEHIIQKLNDIEQRQSLKRSQQE